MHLPRGKYRTAVSAARKLSQRERRGCARPVRSQDRQRDLGSRVTSGEFGPERTGVGDRTAVDLLDQIPSADSRIARGAARLDRHHDRAGLRAARGNARPDGCSVRVHDAAVADDLAGDVGDGVARNGEADPGNGAAGLRARCRQRGDAEDPPVEADSAPPLLPGLIGALV